jgi:DNA repair exonuclease SbcCD ATPase subunit
MSMHQFRGFTDLRVNRQTQSADATLWPSFTDIMTVILMVFMLTMVVVIIKNADLITQIRLSRAMQADSEQQLRDNVQVLADLRLRNSDLEEAVRSSRMEIILLSDEMQRLEDNLEIKAAAIARLGDEKENLEENLRLIRLNLTEKQEELENAQMMIAGIRDEAERTNRELSLQLAELLTRLEENETTMLALTDQKTDLELALARQRKDFSSLEDKYLKLVRPARSALGKEVVSVQYLKDGGRDSYLLKGIGAASWEKVSKPELFSRLGRLKERLGDALYIKIVIPDDSGLSYNEAWDFTKQILSDFDYYYTDGW